MCQHPVARDRAAVAQNSCEKCGKGGLSGNRTRLRISETSRHQLFTDDAPQMHLQGKGRCPFRKGMLLLLRLDRGRFPHRLFVGIGPHQRQVAAIEGTAEYETFAEFVQQVGIHVGREHRNDPLEFAVLPVEGENTDPHLPEIRTDQHDARDEGVRRDGLIRIPQAGWYRPSNSF